jgi:hypothetical protein
MSDDVMSTYIMPGKYSSIVHNPDNLRPCSHLYGQCSSYPKNFPTQLLRFSCESEITRSRGDEGVECDRRSYSSDSFDSEVGYWGGRSGTVRRDSTEMST